MSVFEIHALSHTRTLEGGGEEGQVRLLLVVAAQRRNGDDHVEAARKSNISIRPAVSLSLTHTHTLPLTLSLSHTRVLILWINKAHLSRPRATVL